MTTTTNLGITLLEQSQAQKEVTVNEALNRIDAVLNSGAKDKDLNTPPGSPAQGDLYIIASSPTGAWAGKALQIAYFDQVWRFIPPHEGAMLWVDDENTHYLYNGTTWQSIDYLADMEKSVYDPANIAQQLVGTTATQTLTNKTLTYPSVTVKDNAFTFQDDGDTTKQAQFQLSGITTGTTRTLTMPNASTTLVGTDATQTLTNKTLTAPVIATISNTGTLTLPTSSDTLVGRATTDTLTNKTLTYPSVTVKDNAFTLQDDGDTTKQLAFQLSGITTGTTRTLTVPNVSDTLAVLGTAQTFSAIQTVSAAGSPVVVNSTGSTAQKITLQDAGTTRGGLGSNATIVSGFTDTGGTLRMGCSSGDDFIAAAHQSYDFGNTTTDWRNAYIKTVQLGGSTSGHTSLSAAATASGAWTFPAATDTVVGKATTDTLTNKTLTSPTIGTSLILPTGTLRGQVTARKTADQSITSSTTLANDSDLTFSIAASEEWVAQFNLDAGAALSTTGVKLAVTAPAGATLNIVASVSPDTVTSGKTYMQRTTTSGTAVDNTTTNLAGVSNAEILVSVWVLNSSTPGSITLQFAQSTSSGTAVTLRKGSFMFASRVA